MADYSTYSDSQLTDLLKASDHAAFSEIYNRYFGLLLVFVHKRLRDEDNSKDIVQELFVTIWTKRETIEFPGVLSTYLYKSVRNKIINIFTHKDVEKKYIQSIQDFLDHEPIMSDYLIREKELSLLIEKEINLLPARMREAFLLSREANMTYKEISERMDLTKQSVRSTVKNALKKLRVGLGT